MAVSSLSTRPLATFKSKSSATSPSLLSALRLSCRSRLVPERFVEWRVALMELGLVEVNIGGAIKPITADYDPYKMTQVHDYKGISFLRQTDVAKAASKETITVLGDNYPELLKEKFFVNIPAIMGFFYGVMKMFVSKKTLKKFHPLSSGTNLAKEFVNTKVDGLGDKLPAEYGGKGADLKTLGKTPIVQ